MISAQQGREHLACSRQKVGVLTGSTHDAKEQSCERMLVGDECIRAIGNMKVVIANEKLSSSSVGWIIIEVLSISGRSSSEGDDSKNNESDQTISMNRSFVTAFVKRSISQAAIK